MKNMFFLFVFIISNVIVIHSQTVSNVRLVDHTSYAVSLIEKVMNRVGTNSWCNLKVDDVYMSISENVMGEEISGDVEFTNGFLVSVQHINLVQSTVQQVWVPFGNTTSVEIRATMRMMDVVIGFDVVAKLNTSNNRMTAVMRYPEVQFPFVISKNLFTDEFEVTVGSNLIRTTNLISMVPEYKIAGVVSVMFDWNCIAESIRSWAIDIFAPITLDLAKNEVEFPRICYNCNV